MEYFLFFQNGERHFAIPNRYVKEILHIMQLTSIPEMPYFLKGFLNYSSEIIPIIDFNLLQNGTNKASFNPYSQIVLLKGVSNLGIFVDKVTDFKSINLKNNLEIRKDEVVNDVFYGLFKNDQYDTYLISIENLLLKEEKERIQFLQHEMNRRKKRIQ